MRLPGDALVAREKLTDYLLRWRPEDDKSTFLAQAGYTLENADRLMANIREQLMPLDAVHIENTEYGENCLWQAFSPDQTAVPCGS
jgi:hypothetical protein